MRCAACASEAEAGDRFCAECGAELGPVCGACGEALQPDDGFCPQCGTPVDAGAETKPPARPRRRAAKKPKPKGGRPPAATAGTKPTEGPKRKTQAKPAAPPAPAPRTSRPAPRFWPGSRGGQIGLAAALAFGVLYGFAVEDGGPAAALASVAIVYVLFAIWRNILLGFGLFQGSAAPPAQAPPGAAPETADPVVDAEGGAKGCTVLGVIGLLVGLLLAKLFGKLLREFLQGL